jgi:NAD(P)-dependent dehydrogenase (short-subunit alcohol dehydrogenase family)
MLAKPFNGKIAVVTGAGGDIGRSMVHLFVLSGAKVVALRYAMNQHLKIL